MKPLFHQEKGTTQMAFFRKERIILWNVIRALLLGAVFFIWEVGILLVGRYIYEFGSHPSPIPSIKVFGGILEGFIGLIHVKVILFLYLLSQILRTRKSRYAYMTAVVYVVLILAFYTALFPIELLRRFVHSYELTVFVGIIAALILFTLVIIVSIVSSIYFWRKKQVSYKV